MSLIAHDVAFGHFRLEIAHAICFKKKKKCFL
jgi:hypothetical protein